MPGRDCRFMMGDEMDAGPDPASGTRQARGGRLAHESLPYERRAPSVLTCETPIHALHEASSGWVEVVARCDLDHELGRQPARPGGGRELAQVMLPARGRVDVQSTYRLCCVVAKGMDDAGRY